VGGYHSRVFPVSPIVVVIGLLIYAAAGAAIGAFTGWLVSPITKSGPRGISKDAPLGSFGFLAGFIGSIFMPWPRNTTSYTLDGGTSVISTMNTYQHPERVAVALAILLPLVHELYRFKRVRGN
jgi:hypothetical protein